MTECYSAASSCFAAATPVARPNSSTPSATGSCIITGQSAIALTDHDELGGAVRFAQAADTAGIAGIIGAELTVQTDGVVHHLTLLATSRVGYGNISTLITRARMDVPERGAPSVPFALLAEHTDGVFALSGCPRGAVPQALAAGNVAEANRVAGQLRDLFDDAFAIEVWDHRLPEEHALVRQLIPIARRIGVAQYEKAIQTGFREVADALVGRATLGEQLRAQNAQMAAEKTRMDLTDLRFKHGASSAFDVLDAQRSLFAAQQAAVQVQAQQVQNLVTLYKVLGGGWK